MPTVPRLLFGLIAAALFAVAAGVLVIPVDDLGPATRRDGEVRVVPPSGPLLAPRPLEEFAAITERPPFSAARRAVATGPGSDPTLILGRYRLSGVIVAPTARSVILSGPNGTAVTVAEGESVDGWLVDEITVEQVVFSANGQRQTFDVSPVAR